MTKHRHARDIHPCWGFVVVDVIAWNGAKMSDGDLSMMLQCSPATCKAQGFKVFLVARSIFGSPRMVVLQLAKMKYYTNNKICWGMAKMSQKPISHNI